MRFSAILPLAALALAAPAPQADSDCPSNTCETITISDFSLSRDPAKVQSVSFQLHSALLTNSPTTCKKDYPVVGDIVRCSDTEYAFEIFKGTETEYGVRISHRLGAGIGNVGTSDIPTICHSGGSTDGTRDICQSPADVTFNLHRPTGMQPTS